MRKVLHIDCDCFFAAVEMRENPQLRDIPMAIGGRSDRRGVIATCNYPAREYGVRSAMATAIALQQCPQLTLVAGNMPLYKEVSKQVMEIIRAYGQQMEQVSIDEAYLELDPSLSAIEVGNQIRAEVRDKVGVTVSVGAAPNKFLAKVASDWHKPDGLFAVKPHQVEAFVAQLPVSKIHGIGPKTAERLSQKGIITCADVLPFSLLELVQRFGRTGAFLYKRARGVDDRPLSSGRVRKSISVERTYPSDLMSAEECELALLGLWQRLQQRVDSAQIELESLAPFVKIKFADFSQTTLADHLLLPTLENFSQLVLQARQRMDLGVRLIGIGGRCPEENAEQLALF